MMNEGIKKLKVLILAGILPFIYGCGSGGGGLSALSSFLFGGEGGLGFLGGGSGSSPLGIGAGAALSSAAGLSVGGEIATLVNPEPASMMLLGSGLVAMKFLQSQKNRKTTR